MKSKIKIAKLMWQQGNNLGEIANALSVSIWDANYMVLLPNPLPFLNTPSK